MAANPKLPMVSGSLQQAYHEYHAEAFLLSGKIEHPIEQPIEQYGRVILNHTRRESLITQSVGETNVEGLISFKRGQTRVAGTHVQQKKDIYGNDHAGWTTLSTAAMEGYNILDIITVDRVVAQLTTEHPLTNDPAHPIAHVPRVNFIGTRFENLRIAGYPVEVELDLGFCGPKPQGDRPYLLDNGFLDRVKGQIDEIIDSDDFPESLEEDYRQEIASISDLRKRAKDRKNDDGRNKAGASGGASGYPTLRCSLVKKIKLKDKIPGVTTFGNAIFIQDYGTVYLAEVEVGINHGDSDSPNRGNVTPSNPSESNYFKLHMFDMRLGCGVGANGKGGGVSGNGQSYP
jgi:hypothetical protein